MSWRIGTRPLRSVLVTRLRYLGDIVMSTVVLQALRDGDPALDVGYLCEWPHGVVLDGHPQLDRIHQLGSRRRGADAQARVAATGGTATAVRGTLGTVRELRRHRYDLAVDLFFNPRSAWLLRLAGIPVRIGGTTGSRRRLYSHIVRREDLVPEEEWDAVAAGGLGEHLARLAPLHHVESDLPFLDWARREYAERPPVPRLGGRDAEPGTGAIILAPAATWPSKEWPLAHWAALVDGLLAAGVRRLEVVTPPGQEGRFAPLARDPERVTLLPPGDMDQVAARLAQASGVISVDGGLMHVAVGLGTPTLALFGPTDPRAWFPYAHLGPFRVLATRPHCHPCHLHDCDAFICLPDLAPARVVDEALALFGAGGGA